MVIVEKIYYSILSCFLTSKMRENRTEDGTTTENAYTYDPLGQLTSFTKSTGYSEQYTYDAAGNMLQKVITGEVIGSASTGSGTSPANPAAVILKMQYNKANQLISMANGQDRIAYSYDKNGSMVKKVLTSKAYGTLTDTYTYNPLDQLTGYMGYDGYQQQLTYDANGMRLTKKEAGNGNRSTLEELLRGNIAGLPEVMEPTSSPINKDTKSAEQLPELEWATTEYLYDLTQEYYQVIEEKTTGKSGTSKTAYAYGLERIAAYGVDKTGITSKTNYVYDGRGSVAQSISLLVPGENANSTLAKASAPIAVQSFSYTAFGEQMSRKVSGFGYNAEAFDAAAGMMNLRARQYEPHLNRFHQKDIIDRFLDNGLSCNRYLYTQNKPVPYADNDGMLLRSILNGVKKLGKAILQTLVPRTKAESASDYSSQIKRNITNLKSAITAGYLKSSNINDPVVKKAYQQTTKEIAAAEKSRKKPLTDHEKDRFFAEACIIQSLQLSMKYGMSNSTAFTYEETIAIGKAVKPAYDSYSAQQKKDKKANYCIKFALAPYKTSSLYDYLDTLNTEWKKKKLASPFSPLTTSSAMHAGLVGIASRALLAAGEERRADMQDNVALAVSVGSGEAIKVMLPRLNEYIELYDSKQFSLSLDEQRRLVGLSGITKPLDIVLTNSNADKNILYGVDYAQNHGVLLLSPTTYAGVNANTWPKDNDTTNFIKKYSQSENNKVIGFDYVIINNNSDAIEELTRIYNYFSEDFDQWR